MRIRAYHAQDNLAAALQHYGQVFQARQDFTPAALASSHILIKLGSNCEAVNTYVNALTQQPNSIEILVGLAAFTRTVIL